MRNDFRGLGLILSTAMLLGCPPSPEVKNTAPAFNSDSLPSDPEALIRIADEQQEQGGARNAAAALERALKNQEYANNKASYEAEWRLARAYAELSEPDGDQRWRTVPPGLAAAKKAIELNPERVEGHYYMAELIGFSALLQKGDTKQLIQGMVSEAETAVRIDEKFDHAGPLRVLGALLARAPKEPVSVGDPEKAAQYMKRAVAADDSFPPNHIYLAEAYVADERYQEADSELTLSRKLLADSRWERQQSVWKEQLNRVEHKLRAKQS
jgi:hypothetical protein